MNIAVVLVGYNRPATMKRLMQSVCSAEYSVEDNVDLVLSLDYSDKQSEQKAAFEELKWQHGSKVLRVFPERQGLRKHVLQCGDLTQNYDAVVVLEDDLIVAKGYMNYVSQAIRFYDDNDSIAGISLYTHRTNPGNGRYFEAVNNGYDAYLKQYAQSWGQCWTKKMWQGFRQWYAQNEDLANDPRIPNYVLGWNKQSWLKYYISYTALMDKFFVYPHVSLSTNASDVGEHCRSANNDYQVPLREGLGEYRFPTVEQAIKYDAFFERIFREGELFPEILGKKTLDLYGLRVDFSGVDVLISTQRLDYKMLATFSLKYRPQETNCQVREAGDVVFVYDLHVPEKNKVSNRYEVARYDIRALSWHSTLLHGLQGLKNAVLIRLPFKRGK